ncbi:MAG: adenosine deaminase [Frankiales bacterium]|jgi:adenosine deaminase|nr:adenosine deaminase [Frankiales bacterium]
MTPVGDLSRLPKAHLHLHLTGGMRPRTLRALAAEQGRVLPHGLLEPSTVDLDATGLRGWLKFQRLYDAARAVLTGPAEVQRVVREIVEDQAAAGVGWLELQVDPSSYAPRLGGLQATVELVLDALQQGSAATGVGTGLVLAGNRTRNPAETETHARLARRFAGRGVVGLGLSNDETRGDIRDFEKAFRLARDAGLIAVPHAGELRGAGSVRLAVERLGAQRVGHGVRAVEDPDLLELLATLEVACEVNPVSNLALHVHTSVADNPWRQLRAAGVPVAVGADDPLLFGADLVANYAALAPTDAEAADLARCSITASTAPEDRKARLLAAVDAWLTP